MGSDLRAAVRASLEKRAGLSALEAQDMEIGAYNWSLQCAEQRNIARSWNNGTFASIYTQKANGILDNLDPLSPVGNSRLLQRMREQEFLPHELPFMRPEHVFPERWKEVLDAKIQKDEYIHNQKPAAMTDQFKCGRCKKRECVYQELQLRSCDEPVSLFITCLNCGNRWRIG